MRLTLLTILILNSALALGQDAEFSFDHRTIKLDDVEQGEVIDMEFPFSNDGDAPLIISSISVSCKCTQFEFPAEPIMPGDSSVIYVSFNTSTVWDLQDRTLEVHSNAKKSPEKLRFKVFVVGEDLSK